MIPFFVVFLGAGLGGALRHAVGLASIRLFGPSFPWGTVAVNIGGSLLMGAAIGYFALKADPGAQWRLFLTTGLLGGFTTFSTFSLDTVFLIENSHQLAAGGYVLLSVAGSLAGLFLGLALVRGFT